MKLSKERRWNHQTEMLGLTANDGKPTPCPHCGGKGHYFVMPEGMNPFYMGAIAASKAAEQKTCSHCKGTGHLALRKEAPDA